MFNFGIWYINIFVGVVVAAGYSYHRITYIVCGGRLVVIVVVYFILENKEKISLIGIAINSFSLKV